MQADTVRVTFDSDLNSATVTDGVAVLDAKGKRLEATASYANRVVTVSGLNLKQGDSYRLAVLTSLLDVSGQNVAAEYDLDFVGPTIKKHPNHKEDVTASPSPSPSPSPTPA